MDPSAHTRAPAALSGLLVSDASLTEGIRSMLQVVQDAVPTAHHAGLSMPDERGRPVTPISTDPAVAAMDQAQYDSDRGPCLDAWRRTIVVSIPDMGEATERYPEFAAACADHGVRSTLSVPLSGGGESLGAVNLYSSELRGFGPRDEALLRDVNTAAGAFLANAKAYWRAFDLSTQLDEAMSSRAVIEQAKGMLMAADPDLDPDGAFELLKRASQRENVKLRVIAARIVHRTPPPADD